MQLRYVFPPLLAASLVFAQDKETLWTRVTAQHLTVSLAWDKQHPWDPALTAGAVQLVARHRGSYRGGEALQVVAPARRTSAKDRSVQFNLPESLGSAASSGSVCLFFQMADRKVLPVRKATKENSDTAGFRYVVWEQRQRRATEAVRATQRVAAAEQALQVADRNVEQRAAVIQRNKWPANGACDALQAGRVESGAKPYGVVAAADHDEVSRRVCVYRVWKADQRSWNLERVRSRLADFKAAFDNASKPGEAGQALAGALNVLKIPYGDIPILDVAFLLDVLQQKLGAGHATVRQRQLEAFLGDWRKWGPGSPKYDPHLGLVDDTISWPSTAVDAALRVFSRTDKGRKLIAEWGGEWAMEALAAPTIEDVGGVLGGALDAYDGCLEDSRKLLAINLQEWEKQQASAPRRTELIRQDLIRMCRSDFALLEKLRQERVGFQQQLEAERKAVSSIPQPPPLPGSPIDLNRVACAP